MNNLMAEIVNRAADAVGSYGRTRTSPERADALAVAGLAAQAASQHLQTFAHWCYKRTERGDLLHVLDNGQIPTGSFTPWGASGKSRMTRGDRDMLRDFLMIMRRKNHDPVWFYMAAQRRWFVDFTHHPTLPDALAWLTTHPITGEDWISLAKRGRARRNA